MSRAGYFEEMGFANLVVVIIKRWWLVLPVFILFSSISAYYAKRLPEIYEVKFGVVPPSVRDVADLNYGRLGVSGLKSYEVRLVYKAFVVGLHSAEVLRDFQSAWNAMKSANANSQKRTVLSDRINIYVPAVADADGRYTILVRGADPDLVAEHASAYMKFVGDLARREMIAGAQHELDQVRDAMAALLSLPVVEKNSADGGARIPGDNSAASIELQRYYQFYKNAKIDGSKVAVYRIEGEIPSQGRFVGPNRVLILFFGAFFGLIFGCCLAVGVHAIAGRSGVR
ncbi:Wzz/FepE/Etk N-terminal domain-containing protein [Pseudomonas vanderleydeniana]|uniref:Polysaccharide chain length determinant N-terminal domain-containing protein n=1 Tax=Pseudomonas vanderleydeniana TaxID=2745495 RepID=A0A9E6PNT3_9PSED|nr:Wzz/FepE/Etk N-terminal domain-containing protein [Pseudomonas vanderleydeniana]QXI30217.1 hypothetical protein HU752_009785 [Pseudomonas vanderleydeniana]